MSEMIFETFEVPSMYIAVQALLALFCSGRTTGVVLDCGEGVSHSVAIYEGFALETSLQRINLAGQDVTDYLIKCLNDRGHNFKTSAEREIVRELKEKHCYVASRIAKETLATSKNIDSIAMKYLLPDGQTISIDNERFMCPEVLFNPRVLGIESLGIHQALYNSIYRSDIDLRRELYNNIVLAGGTTMLQGLVKRIEYEILEMAPRSVAVKVTAPNERQHSVWLGGAIFAELPGFSTMSVTKEEYEEYGNSIVQRKCF